ncbi:hypothetical protein OWV82_020289 [Melia azedarach]|uniref:Uncharacterized protein n=1 Tax=Melia azedarach TaxID=155640 RepID=A0ACC1X645_MELAZ|nr:hypothetical protein OWV82_020289 [Melia azedarach]
MAMTKTIIDVQNGKLTMIDLGENVQFKEEMEDKLKVTFGEKVEETLEEETMRYHEMLGRVIPILEELVELLKSLPREEINQPNI